VGVGGGVMVGGMRGDIGGEGRVVEGAAASLRETGSDNGGAGGGGWVEGEGGGQGGDCSEGDSSEEDDHNYEITDFSMVTPWERLIEYIYRV
jgi:hypothetical protein